MHIPHSFYSRLEQHYPPELFHEMAESISDLKCQSATDTLCSPDIQGTGLPFEDMAIESTKDGPSSSNDVVVGISNTSLDDSGPIRIQSESAKGGTVAALVRVLFGTSGGSRMVRQRDIALISSFPAIKPRNRTRIDTKRDYKAKGQIVQVGGLGMQYWYLVTQ